MPRKVKRKTTTKRKTATRKPATRRAATRKAATRKTTARRTTAKKTAKRKTTARKAAPAKKVNIGSVKEPLNKSQLMNTIAEATELSKKEISNVFDALAQVMEQHLKKRGPGEFTMPGLMKCVVKRKPATKARKGVNPFTGEEMMFKAKPARNIVKVRPLKKLKEMVE